MKYLVVGGVAAGATCATRLRRHDEEAEIIVFEMGPYVSFSNCGLPYRLSNTIDETDKLVLMQVETLKARYKLDVRVNNKVTSVDAANKKVIVKNLETGEEYEESYDKLVLSPGAKAIMPPFTKEAGMPVFKLKTVPDTAEVVEFLKSEPKHITVIGGGFIGVEVAENLREAGYEVTLVEGSNQILAPFDHEMSLFADDELVNKGVKIIKNKMVEKITDSEVIFSDGESITSNGVIAAIGVSPSTEFLKDSGIEMTERGHIVVDDNYRTSDENIYAAGDAILVTNALTGQKQPLALAGPANKQGRMIADAINGKKVINKGYIGTSGIRVFDKEFAATGLNEKQLKETDIDYEVAYAFPFDRVKLMPGASRIFFKLIFEKGTGRLLGGQATSKGNAVRRIDVLATAIKANMTVNDLLDLELTYAPPFGTGKDAINMAGYIAQNILDDMIKYVSFADVYELKENDAQILDVREKSEVKTLKLQGTINIPFGELRDRLDELDKTKPIYVHCQSSERSYNAVRMLTQKGFDAYNISGSMAYITIYEKMMRYYNPDRKNIVYKR